VRLCLRGLARLNEVIAIGCGWCMGDLDFQSTRRPVDANDDEVAGQTPEAQAPIALAVLLQPRASARMHRSDVRLPSTQHHSLTIA
jgi:hypothetical protein